MTPWFRHSADRRAVVTVLVVFALELWAFFAIHDPLHLLGAVFLLMFAQVSAGAICHNHHHVNIFTKAAPNRLLEVIMYLQTGTSPFSWTIHHNIGHHGDYLDQSIDPSRWQEPDGRTMSRVKYDFYNAFMIYPEIWKLGKRFPTLFGRFKRWLLISNLVLLGFFVYDPVNTLIVFIIPMIAMLVILLDNTYQQHSGLCTDSHFLASRNVEHWLYNLTSWNLGYHTAHHMLPGVHWTELPALHAKIRSRIPEVLLSKKLIPDLNHPIPTVEGSPAPAAAQPEAGDALPMPAEPV